jgi:hypothetical protein
LCPSWLSSPPSTSTSHTWPPWMCSRGERAWGVEYSIQYTLQSRIEGAQRVNNKKKKGTTNPSEEHQPQWCGFDEHCMSTDSMLVTSLISLLTQGCFCARHCCVVSKTEVQ